MKTIFEYPLTDEFTIQTILMPKEAEIIHAGIENGVHCIWALANPAESGVHRIFITLPTGFSLPEVIDSGHIKNIKHLGTDTNGARTWHYFEVIKNEITEDKRGKTTV